MDKTTKRIIVQQSQGPEQTGKPANPEAAMSHPAALSAGGFRTKVISAPSAASDPATARERRCSEKGCVFPAIRSDSAFCEHHRRQQTEPELFRSWQPTWLVIHRSADPDGSAASRSRSHDRFRLAAQSKAFQQGIL
jgi:hypothetical protein